MLRCVTALALLSVMACQSPALLRTARTLPAGSNDLALSLSFTHVSASAAGVPDVIERAASSAFNYPNPVPDILYAHGLLDDLELGGRLSLGSGLLELNAKLRYLEAFNGKLHAALGPALGYRLLGLVNGPVATLPALLTYDLSPQLSLTGGALASFASYRLASGLGGGDADVSGDTLYAGGGVGVQLRTGRFHVLPAVEVQRSLSRTGRARDLPEIGLIFLSLTVGIGPAASTTD